MSKLRYAQRKDANQAEIVAGLLAVGCTVWVMHEPADLLVGRRGINLLLECKDGSKRPSARKLTPAQVAFRQSWRGQFAVVTSVEEALQVVLDRAPGAELLVSV